MCININSYTGPELRDDAEHTGIVMIAVDGEDWVGYVQIWVFVIHDGELAMPEVERGVAEELELTWFLPHRVLPQQINHCIHHRTGWFIVMEEITA